LASGIRIQGGKKQPKTEKKKTVLTLKPQILTVEKREIIEFSLNGS